MRNTYLVMRMRLEVSCFDIATLGTKPMLGVDTNFKTSHTDP